MNELLIPQNGATCSATVTSLYGQYSDFVRRVLSIHGVGAGNLEDATQDVFLVVFRRLDDFVPRASHKTWLFAIATRIAKDYRRRAGRKEGLLEFDEQQVACSRADPYASVVAARALRELERQLGLLDVDRREVFILAQVEQLTAPEIAETLRVKLNTVYSRLRSARREFGFSSKRACA
jgi:RNA polymerase sigma-70 factor (ECF subfamily)